LAYYEALIEKKSQDRGTRPTHNVSVVTEEVVEGGKELLRTQEKQLLYM
jgi:hypothetical protein